ncbi:FliG C-terminal domain-containing protein [Rhodovulum strictum]|uniref:FliG C-terminal domain-containing protein n=1 Tax=Rhodovulum strictum TaxID=58314 RepID=UPI0031B63C2E
MNSLTPSIPGHIRSAAGLTRRRKAAIIVRLLLNEGITLPLGDLPAELQTCLADEIAGLRYIDSPTLESVVEEFVAELELAGLAFPGGMDGAIALLGEHLSPDAAAALQAQLDRSRPTDPWALLSDQEPKKLADLLSAESPEVAAIALAKLPSNVSAAALGQMPGPEARRVALAISRTSAVPPAAIARIGAALARRLREAPVLAFEQPTEKRMGAILDAAPAATRDDVLQGLAETDADLAERVRRAILTFADIPERLAPLDLQALTRTVDQPVLITAMAGADEKNTPTVEFILSNMSQRMAAQLREEIAERSTPTTEETEAAMSTITAALRGLEAAGEIRLKAPKG